MPWPLRITVPWPPTANHSHVTNHFGKRVPTKVAVNYMAEAERITAEEEPEPCAKTRLIVEAHYFAPDLRRRDTDNIRKILADGVAKGLETDDCYFLWRDMDMQLDRTSPRVELTIYPKES